MSVDLRLGDCLEVLATLDDASVDAVVTDPPYGISFMGKHWDSFDIKERVGKRDVSHLGRLTGGVDDAGRKIIARTSSAFATPAGAAGGYDFSAKGNRAFQQWCERWASECLRILKPGGHLVSFGGPRTIHRLVAGIEDAGFEIRDMLSWNFGSGFPKSHNVNSAIAAALPDDALCACDPHSTRIAQGSPNGYPSYRDSDDAQPRQEAGNDQETLPSLDGVRGHIRDDRRGDGLDEGQASTGPDGDTGHPSSADSAPLSEHPLTASPVGGSRPSDTGENTSPDESTAVRRTDGRTPGTTRSASDSEVSLPSRNVNLPRCPDCAGYVIPEGLGTALKPGWEGITLARKPLAGTVAANVMRYGTGALNIDGTRIKFVNEEDKAAAAAAAAMRSTGDQNANRTAYGRFENGPASLGPYLENMDKGRWPANVLLDEEAAAMVDAQTGDLAAGNHPAVRNGREADKVYGSGWTSGTDGERRPTEIGGASRFFYVAKVSSDERHQGLTTPSLFTADAPDRNVHPTVKPIDLMRWLCRLITPAGGLIVDPFLGSGTTGIAAALEGYDFLGIEREPDYMRIAEARISHWAAEPVEAA